MGKGLLNPVAAELFMKLEILRILGNRESLNLIELASELGLQDWEVLEFVNELRKYFMIDYVKGKLTWFSGDNPAKIKPWGWHYVYKVAVGSTMIAARRAPPWSILLAEWQYKSYGRHGKAWISNLGGVWVTLKLEISPRAAQVLPMVIPLAICRYLEERLDIKAKIKWPNDVVVKGKKLAGFLIEAEVLLDKILAYVGIGINVNNEPPVETAISIREVLGKLVPRNNITAYIVGVLGRAEKWSEEAGRVQVQYLEYLETLGTRVKLITRNGTYVGVVKGITESGDIVVETEAGSLKFSSGEVMELRHLD